MLALDHAAGVQPFQVGLVKVQKLPVNLSRVHP